MIVQADFSGNYHEDPIKYFGFEEFADGKDDLILKLGINSKPRCLTKDSNKTIFLDFELPIANSISISEYAYYCKRTVNLCPYSCQMVNEMIGEERALNCYFPVNPANLPAIQQWRNFDVIYTGQVHNAEIAKLLASMQKFKFCHVNYEGGTHRNVSYKDKLKLFCQSKVALIHNTLWLSDHWVHRIKEYPDFERCHIADECIATKSVPQVKSRMFEAAFAGCFMLIKRDHWRLAELFFEADKDFLYFDEDPSDLIAEISDNWPFYCKIAARAQKKAFEKYTHRNFYEDFIKSND